MAKKALSGRFLYNCERFTLYFEVNENPFPVLEKEVQNKTADVNNRNLWLWNLKKYDNSVFNGSLLKEDVTGNKKEEKTLSGKWVAQFLFIVSL